MEIDGWHSIYSLRMSVVGKVLLKWSMGWLDEKRWAVGVALVATKTLEAP